MMSMTRGKCIIFSEDPVGLDTKAEYTDQKGNSCLLDLKKYCELAKKSKEYKDDFWKHIGWIENKELTIGAFVISGLNRLATEFPDKVNDVLLVDCKEKE